MHLEQTSASAPDSRLPIDSTFSEIVQRRVTRRSALKAGLVVAAASVTTPVLGLTSARAARAQAAYPSALSFASIAPDTADRISVAPGYRTQVLLRWGDPLFDDAPAFDLDQQTARRQEWQFGFNCDFVQFMPLPAASDNASEGLLWVNHEYTDYRMMFPTYDGRSPTEEMVNIALAAHGATVVHIRRDPAGHWTYDSRSK